MAAKSNKSKNELVKYHNDMNDISFVGFSSVNYDIFMAIVYRLRDKGEQEIKFSYSDLRKICDIKKKESIEDFNKTLYEMSQRLARLQIILRNDGKWKLITLFPTFEGNLEKQTLTVKINKDFAYMLNEFTAFTQFELRQFTELKSRYSKTLFRKLKQFQSTGVYAVTLDEFRRLFDVPENYIPKRILDKIIKPCMEELAAYFPDLSVEVQRLPKKGAPISGYVFRFTGKDQTPGQMSFANYSIPETQKEGYKRKKQAESKAAEKRGKVHNFPERDTDYKELEKRLLDA